MLSKEDYRNYLEQIETVERTMRDVYQDCLGKVEDKTIKETCTRLMEDEKRHIVIVEALKKLLDL
jgi:rubrerythrin